MAWFEDDWGKGGWWGDVPKPLRGPEQKGRGDAQWPVFSDLEQSPSQASQQNTEDFHYSRECGPLSSENQDTRDEELPTHQVESKFESVKWQGVLGWKPK